jgi:hypothetical protein
MGSGFLGPPVAFSCELWGCGLEIWEIFQQGRFGERIPNFCSTDGIKREFCGIIRWVKVTYIEFRKTELRSLAPTPDFLIKREFYVAM